MANYKQSRNLRKVTHSLFTLKVELSSVIHILKRGQLSRRLLFSI